MKTKCDRCGVQWIHEDYVDQKDHWCEKNGLTLCFKCAEEQAEQDFEDSLKEEDWGHQPC
jgi:hypothetical protein|tara:strand:+ start:1184 stop:1363 length:180 start_codon:yes stop_codon:yes gene_type:complete